jgi:hypothetical protein
VRTLARYFDDTAPAVCSLHCLLCMACSPINDVERQLLHSAGRIHHCCHDLTHSSTRALDSCHQHTVTKAYSLRCAVTQVLSTSGYAAQLAEIWDLTGVDTKAAASLLRRMQNFCYYRPVNGEHCSLSSTLCCAVLCCAVLFTPASKHRARNLSNMCLCHFARLRMGFAPLHVQGMPSKRRGFRLAGTYAAPTGSGALSFAYRDSGVS